jgi:hypothetical protein
LSAPSLELPGEGSDNGNASFDVVCLPGRIEVKTGAGVPTPTPVGLWGRVFATVHPVARRALGWTFPFCAPTVGEHALSDNWSLTLLVIIF